ncbi:MFS transporter [Streptomyces clavuligerus]|nr:MFS transporter [Streptomyces clavuligerus]ANW18724.1 MFS transporter [Streptomyces clavuligerus]AXU16524.1 MFS transporter [Streptomyces clavuligerus]MBY6303242.1 MFS transporter [Streptomyces clavuligerus]QCS06074.1 MFS transporter [Streptomyces clavuligerus]QPJ94566.1 MFS transporter [Streptomyces clavuligerus]
MANSAAAAPGGTTEYKKHPGARILHGPHRTIGGVEAWIVWGLCTIFVVWLFSIQTGYAVVSPEIQRTASLTVAQIGLAGSIYTWAFALCQFFSGALLDRFGSRPLLTIAVAFVTAGAFLYAQTSSMGTLIAAQIVLAVGSSFGFVGAGYIGGQWFPAARYGLMFGMVQCLASLGSAFGQPAISWQLTLVSWQQLLNGFGAAGVVLIVLFALLVRNPSPGPEQLARATAAGPRPALVPSILRDLGACFRNRNVVLSALLAGVSFGSMLAMGVLWGPRVMEARGAESSLAAVLTAMSWLGLAIGAPLFNLVSDHWNNRRLPAVTGVLLQAVAVSLLIYLPTETNSVSVVTMFCVGLFAGAHMLGFTVAGESVPGALVGSSAAIVNGVCFIVGGLLQAIPGKILPAVPDLADFGHALLMMPILLVLGAAAGFFIKETGTARQDI